MDEFEEFFQTQVKKIESIVRDRHPMPGLSDEFWKFVLERETERYGKMKAAERQMEEFWLNRVFPEFKKFVLEWGREYLEMFKAFYLYLQQQEAKAA